MKEQGAGGKDFFSMKSQSHPAPAAASGAILNCHQILFSFQFWFPSSGFRFIFFLVIDHLSILAPGLIGASVAKAARARDAARHITIWARRQCVRDALRSQPFADTIADTPAAAVRDATLVVLAAPVEQIIALAAQIAPALRPGAIVTDVGSVKTRVCEQCAAAMPPHATFVGSHPMAGGAKAGWENSTGDLFIGRTAFVTPAGDFSISDAQFSIAQATPGNTPARPCPVENRESKIENPRAAALLLRDFWRALGANPVLVAPGVHDEIVAHTSHLPQILASTLAAFLAQKNPQWRAHAGNGLRDTTRIAASDTTMWIEILMQNRPEILRALDAWQSEMAAFRAALDAGDWPRLRARLEAGKQFRDSL